MSSILVEPHTAKTKYWHSLPNGKVQCDVCPRECQLQEGQRGFCYVRAREGNEVVLKTYGRSSGFCIDPIEKKPLYHFLPGTPILSFGTAGCNLACIFCQNWDISKSREDDTLMQYASPEMIAQACKRQGCQSVAFTYNDPTIFIEYAIDVAEECHKLGIKTVAVTAGYINEAARNEFYSYIDAANVDLKGFTERFYKELCGGRLQTVLDTLYYLKNKTNVWIEITTLLIPGENDSDAEIDAETKWIKENLGPDVPLHFSAFHPDYKMTTIAPTPVPTLRRARDIAHSNGLHYVYTGNVYDPEGATTYCAQCKQPLIQRAGYSIDAYRLDETGQCKACKTTCAGIFASTAGDWGSRRQSVSFR